MDWQGPSESGTGGKDWIWLPGRARAVPWDVSEPWKLQGVCPSLTGTFVLHALFWR